MCTHHYEYHIFIIYHEKYIFFGFMIDLIDKYSYVMYSDSSTSWESSWLIIDSTTSWNLNYFPSEDYGYFVKFELI